MIYIIGAGPAGLATGLFLLEEGYDVTIFEKEEKIKSTACGEACDLESLKILPFDSTPYFEREINKIKFIFNDKYFYANVKGVVLNRQKWLEGMAEEFIKRGGKIRFSTKVMKVDDRYIYTKNEKIDYGTCIGADGPLSVARKYVNGSCKIEVGSEYEMEYKMNENSLNFYLSRKYSHHYAWIFPKRNTINVGLIGNFSMLDKFINNIGIKGKIISKKAGIIPYGIDKIVRGSVALIGDAACMTNPFSLGGIAPAIYAAKILSKNIVNLQRYEEGIKNHEIANPILMKGKRAIEKLKEEEIAKVFEKVDKMEIGEIEYKKFLGLAFHPITAMKFYHIGEAMLHSLKWGW